jgi:hypothetical protein
LRTRRSGIRLNLRHEFGALKLQRRKFSIDRLVKFLGGLVRAAKA